jgi:hypothetical protein
LLREDDMTDDYANGRCCAIKRDGKRCTGRWAVAAPCIISRAADGSTFMDGPTIVLCRRHRHRVYRFEGKPSVCDGKTRFRVVHGWMGSANDHGYGTSVFAARTGWKVAPWWKANAKILKFGESRRDCP